MNLLISGVACDIGFGVGRILKDWRWSGILHGMDLHDQHAGSFVFDQIAVSPRASEPAYIDWLSDYIAANEITFFIPTSEAEISRLANEGVVRIGSAQILKSNDLTILKSLDKYECLGFLSEHGIKVPSNGVVGKHPPEGYPIIVKPRSGQGSKNILHICDKRSYIHLKSANSIWQEYLVPDDEEYTCAVYRSSLVGTRILVLRRKLQGGLTGSGEVIQSDEILEYIGSIAIALNLDGVMNVQLRLTSSGPMLFEINPRLSSTLVFRDQMGFCDLRWWLADKIGMDVPAYHPPKVGTKFYRGAHEYIIYPKHEKSTCIGRANK